MRSAGALAAGVGAFVGFVGGTVIGAVMARSDRNKAHAGGTFLFAQAFGTVAGAAMGGAIGAEAASSQALTPPTSVPAAALTPPAVTSTTSTPSSTTGP